MPYRAILITVVTVALALLAAGMWIRAIAPLLVEVNASTQPSPEHPGITDTSVVPQDASKPAALPATVAATTPTPATDPDRVPVRPDKQFKGLIKAITWATFIIIVLLFALGFFVTLRTWMRSLPDKKSRKTRYVDAWKLAGERLEAKDDNDSSEPKEGSDNG